MTRFALVVQHHGADTPGAIARELRARGVEPRDVLGFEGDTVPESIGEASALVVMGGPMSAGDVGAHPFLAAERGLIASAIAARVPVLGVCLGAQLLASVLGGSVSRGGEKEIGWEPVELAPAAKGDPLFGALPARITPLHWHGDAVALPPGATLLARSRLTDVQAFRAGDWVYGLQFHLEGDAEMIRTMVQTFGDELREEGVNGERILEEAGAHLAEQERLARIVFGRWAERVAAG